MHIIKLIINNKIVTIVVCHTDLLIFITSGTILDDKDEITIGFQLFDERRMLEAETCFNKVILPISHTDYESFKKACISSVEYGKVGFGKF